jgi:N-acetylneuraminic acid mutarotase
MPSLLAARRGGLAVVTLVFSGALSCGGSTPTDGAGGAAAASLARPIAPSSADPAAALRAAFPAHASRVLDAGAPLRATGAGFEPLGGPEPGLRGRLPRLGDGAVELDVPGGATVRVREDGAGGEGVVAGRAVAYARAGGSSYWTLGPGAAEEWLRFDEGAVTAGRPAATWAIEGATVRQQGSAVEVVDGNAARLRVTAPEAFAAGGRPVAARLVAQGARVELWIDDAEGEALLVDPQWSPTANAMSALRGWHTATLLTNGKVVAAGGANNLATQPGSYEASADLYDPATSLWSKVGPMTSPRYRHAAALLPNGKVLVAGGFNVVNPFQYDYLDTAEVFDPGTSLWTATGSMSVGRSYPTLTTLGNGKVLVVGGYDGANYQATAELWDPATGAWTSAGSLSGGRRFHTATVLSNGKVLVAGGYDTVDYADAFLYDPATSSWSSAGTMTVARAHHTATLLPNGKVLVTGGDQETDQQPAVIPLQTTELYDPATQTWTSAASMLAPRAYHTATLLPLGKVLVAGGRVDGTNAQALSELYDPANDSWSSAGSMTIAREFHTANLLQNGKVLVAGGSTADNAAYLSTSELFNVGNLANGAPCAGAGDCQSGFCVDGVCCNSPCNQGACNACAIKTGAPSDGACFGFTGKACNDGNACTTKDVCQSGVCVGSSPVVCPAGDVCHFAGVCNPQTGQCASTPKPDGTGCSDGNPCTTNDACFNGVCTSGSPVVCQPVDGCHVAGVCNPNTGACSNPVKADGSACNDGNACSQTDVCKAGKCVGSNPVACAPLDPCHVAGSCDPQTGQCSAPAAPDGTSCDDGNPCTTKDACFGGSCTGGVPLDCPPPDACHGTGVCNPATGNCSYPSAVDGTACNDGNACTTVDTCVSGVCTGSSPVSCPPVDECHVAGSCQPASGACDATTKPDGTVCSIGRCYSGVCSASPPDGGAGGAGSGGGGPTGQGGGQTSTTSGDTGNPKGELVPSDTGGCGCRVAAAEDDASPRWLALGLLLVLRRRRRAR